MSPWLNKSISGKDEVLLEGKQVFVRPAQMDDWAEWAKIRADNRTFLEPFEPLWAEKCLTKRYFSDRIGMQTRNWQYDRAYAFLIFEKSESGLVGGININNVMRGAAQFASLGYWLGEDHQGHGFMVEAAKLIVGYAFTELGLERLNAGCLVHNDRSQNMLKRLGFSEEGFAPQYLQINGSRQDHVLFGLNKESWAEN